MNIYLHGDGYIAKYLYDKMSLYGLRIIQVSEHISSKADVDTIYNVLYDFKADVIINAIGMTDTNACEKDKDRCLFTNVEIPMLLYRKAIEKNALFVQLSTGCIYDDGGKGMSMFEPEDTPNFTDTYYTFSKATAEALLIKKTKEEKVGHLAIHRIRLPFSEEPHPKNLIDKLCTFEDVVDCRNSITCLEDYVDFLLAECREYIVSDRRKKEQGKYKISHAVNPVPIGNRAIVHLMREKLGDKKVKWKNFITPAQLNEKVGSPRANCTLAKGTLSRNTEEALSKTLDEYVDNI